MTEPVAKTAFDRLTEAAILTCPRCAGSLHVAGEGLVCDAGHETGLRRGVLDLYIAPELPTGADAATDRDEEVAAVFAQHLELPLDWVRDAALLEPLPPTGNPFLDAEEDLFLDRFALFNKRAKLEIVKVYSTGRLQAGVTNWIAVRVRNAGLFPLSSASPKPLFLAYHWLDANGNLLDFEGLRSALPVDVKPAQAVTAHLQVAAPAAPGRYRLQIVPVHETVAWLHECAVTIDVEASADAPAMPRAEDAGRPFDELLDNVLAEAFIARRIGALADPIRGLEIGGATSSALSEWARKAGRAAALINGDISVRLLRLAAVLTEKAQDRSTTHVRLAAERLPIRDGALDVVTFRRALHHFDDPAAVLRECARALKPDGQILLLCEPVAHVYDDETRNLIRAGVNEQVFPLDGYLAMFAEAGLEAADMACDWGFSLKAALRKQPTR